MNSCLIYYNRIILAQNKDNRGRKTIYREILRPYNLPIFMNSPTVMISCLADQFGKKGCKQTN